MKLTAGLGSVDDYIRYIEAGADECFCGYIPYAWDKKYGTVLSLNRREVRCCSVQLGAFSELEILAAMVRAYQKPVQLTFNSLYYLPKQYPEIAETIQKCMKIGFRDYIIADPALIVYLRQQKIDCRISLSGEVGEINSAMAGLFEQLEISRIIFPRKMRPEDMAAVARACAAGSSKPDRTEDSMEYEAFALNELCQFSGAFCNSLHCDEMGYLCRVPYQVGGVKSQQCDATLFSSESDPTAPFLGESGCGLCALYDLRQAGMTHLKIVGRGNHPDQMVNDIRAMKRALGILETSKDREDYQNRMKQELFFDGCSQNCYYLSNSIL